ncbi:MAG TPA: hypothetical protein VGB89_03450 [Bacteroidota bacterium]|jgi:hypothetical protein
MTRWNLIALFFMTLEATALTALGQSLGELDTGYKIQLLWTEEPPGLGASINSTTLYPCVGYIIRSNVERSQDTLQIYMTGMIAPKPCLQDMNEATGTCYLGNIEGGSYFVAIYYRGRRDLYRLTIDDRELIVHPVQTTFTTVQDK